MTDPVEGGCLCGTVCYAFGVIPDDTLLSPKHP